MINWLNKQLNEKHGVGSSVFSGASTYKPPVSSSLASIKPPVGGMPQLSTSSSSSTLFKPTFSSIDQLNSGGNNNNTSDRMGSYERSPFRTLNNNNNNVLNTPSSLSSATS